MVYYGECLVFYEVPEKYTYMKNDELKLFEEYLFRMKKILSSMTRGGVQERRAEKDIDTLRSYIKKVKNGKRYGVTRKRYVGHKYVPKKVNNKYPVIETGYYIWW